MPEPDYAVVDILCSPAKLADLKAIPNLLVEIRPEYTDDPALILVHAFADSGAQAAATAMGCVVTIVKSAEEYRQQVDAAYSHIQRDTGPDS